MNVKKLAVTLVVALALVLSVGTASVMGEVPSASACCEEVGVIERHQP
jgi:hypothetical protein